MFIANQLKNKNRAEYLLYMWQVEDILRANGCDIDRLRENYLCQFKVDDAARKELEEWYGNLCNMMHNEGVVKSGHLQINQVTLQRLVELHEQLVTSPKFPFYRSAYYKVLPYIVELRAKGEHKEEPELQSCFDALYGVMVLKLQKKEVSAATAAAVKDITTLIGMLSDYYQKNEEHPIEF